MVRGAPLRDQLVRLIWANRDLLDAYTEERFLAMTERYRIPLP